MAVDCDKLKDAIASGRLKVKDADGNEVEYRSLAEMVKIHELFCGPIVPPSTTDDDRASISSTLATFCKRGTR